ncbi:TetR/AcrR family transcriptional regulator [Microbacterium sp. NPDC055521]
MLEHPQDPSRSGSRGRGLTRESIVSAALAQIDELGMSALSMRSLAERLDVEAMSLYRYIHGREDLLEGVVDLLIGDLMDSLDGEVAEHWQGFLQAMAHQVRQIAVEHPRAFPLLASPNPAAPWLRPPLRSVELVDAFLTALLDRGFSDAQAVVTYRSFSSFLLGQLLLQAAAHDTVTAPPPDSTAEQDEPDAAIRAPQVFRLRQKLSEDHSREEFEAALETLLDRLENSLARHH